MTSSFTTNLNLEKPANGDYPDTWNVPVNSDWDVLDKARGGSVTKTLSSTDVTLTISESQNAQIVLTGTLTANVNLILPFQSGSTTAAVGGSWSIYNNTTGSHTVAVITSVSGSTGITLKQGYRALVLCDQTNVSYADDPRIFAGTGLTLSAGTMSLSNPVAVSLGGTGNNSYTDGQLLIGNTLTGGLTKATLTAGTNVTITNSNGAISIAASGGGGGGSGTVTSVGMSGASTGLTFTSSTSNPVTTNGTFTLGGTLAVANGGTGAATLTGYLKGNGTSAFTASSTIPGSDISGAVATATTATTATTANNVSSTININTSGSIVATGGFSSGTGGVSGKTLTATGTGVAISTSSGQISGTYNGGTTWTGASIAGSSSSDWAVEATQTSVFSVGAGAIICRINSTTNPLAGFYVGTSNCGLITATGTGPYTTVYGTTSDYRLKENVVNSTNGLATVKALRPVDFTWKGATVPEVVTGFLAHEIQAIVPIAVAGEKDAINADGTIRPQNVDYAKLVPYLVQAIQELSARVEHLEAIRA